MPRGRVASAGLAALIALALPGASALAADALYQWTDERGNVRYTPDPDRIPPGQRASMRRLEPELPAAIAPARPLSAPTPSAAALRSPPAAASAPAPVVAVPSAVVPVATPAPTPAPVESMSTEPAAVAAPQAPVIPVAVPETRSAAVRDPSPAATPPAPDPTPRSNAAAAPAPGPRPAAADAAREQQLSAEIAADQEMLKSMLSAPSLVGETSLVDSPELRAIARRLPELQAELSALRERQTPPAGP